MTSPPPEPSETTAGEAKPSEAPLRNTDQEPQVILVSVDASNAANGVVSTAARFMRAIPSATLHVLHIFRTSRVDRKSTWGSPGNDDLVQEARDTLEFHVRSARKQCRSQVVGHFALGDPTGEILRVANDIRAEMIVVGTHDQLIFERLLLGSVAESIMRKARCSVVIVRPPPKYK